nr:MAG TPA: hypothetical protein [Caudoviricetes sp.]
MLRLNKSKNFFINFRSKYNYYIINIPEEELKEQGSPLPITGKDSAQNFIPRVLVAVLRSLVKTNSTNDMRISDIVIVLRRILTQILHPRLLPLREIRLSQGGCGR